MDKYEARWSGAAFAQRKLGHLTKNPEYVSSVKDRLQAQRAGSSAQALFAPQLSNSNESGAIAALLEGPPPTLPCPSLG